MNYSGWEIEDVTSQNDPFKCALGINKQTGRLQWCPGSKYIKMFVLIPAALLPVILVILILTHPSLVGSVHPSEHQQKVLQMSNFIERNDVAFNAKVSKCFTIRYPPTESMNNEDRELWKDVRTSFVPTESLDISPNCKHLERNEQNDLDNESSLVPSYLDFSTIRFHKYIDRLRRDLQRNNDHNKNNSFIDNEAENNENTKEQWEIMNNSEKDDVQNEEISVHKNAVTEKASLNSLREDKNVPDLYNSFWRQEG